MQNKVLAVIDIGSLKAKFEIKAFDENLNSKTLHKEVIKTELLKDLHKNGNYIIEQSIINVVNAINSFKTKMQQHLVIKFDAITTEAFRKAKNSKEVLERIKKETGITLRILDGKEEGKLLFTSISSDFKDEVIVVVDVGSASVQVVIGKNNKIYRSYSFPTGTYAWFNQPVNRRFPTIEETQKEFEWVKEQLKSLQDNGYNIKYLVYGTTSLIDFFKAMKFELVKIKRKAHEFYSDISDLKDLYEKVIKLPYEERSLLHPDDPYYMWGIDKAFMNVITISEYLKVNKIVPTNNNVSSGIFNELALKL